MEMQIDLFDEYRKERQQQWAQSRISEEWWHCATECYRFLRNMRDKLADGKTAYEQTLGEKFDGLLIPFGAEVCHRPMSSKDEVRLHFFGKNTCPRIITGVSRAGEEHGQATCSSRIAKTSTTCQPQFHVQTDLSNSSILLKLLCDVMPRRKAEHDEKRRHRVHEFTGTQAARRNSGPGE